MARMHVHVGLDDIGTGTGRVKGSTFITMPEAHLPKFEEKFAELLRILKKPQFHAQDFGAKKRTPAFVGLLELIGDLGRRSSQVRAVTCLYDSSKAAALRTSAQAALDVVAAEIGLSRHTDGPTVLDEAMHLADKVMIIARHSDWMGPDMTMAITIASGPKTHYVGDTVCSVDGVPWDASSLLRDAMNRTITQEANNTPTLVKSPVTVVAARNSSLAQAADVFGNFFLCHLRQKHGASSRGVVEKAEIVRRVFGGLLTETPPSKELSWDDQGDLRVQPDSLVTIQQRFYMTKPPRGKRLADFPGVVSPSMGNDSKDK